MSALNIEQFRDILSNNKALFLSSFSILNIATLNNPWMISLISPKLKVMGTNCISKQGKIKQLSLNYYWIKIFRVGVDKHSPFSPMMWTCLNDHKLSCCLLSQDFALEPFTAYNKTYLNRYFDIILMENVESKTLSHCKLLCTLDTLPICIKLIELNVSKLDRSLHINI